MTEETTIRNILLEGWKWINDIFMETLYDFYSYRFIH